MKKPIILAVDDDAQVLAAIRSDLRSRYRNDYRIMATTSANEALEAIVSLKNKGEEAALFLSDQRMPEMLGVDFLEKALVTFPQAKRVLLTAYSDTDAAIKAINDVQLDYYLLKPWNPPEEKLFPVIDDVLQDWLAHYSPPFTGLRIVGYQFSPNTHYIKDFLAGNMFPYQFLNIENDATAKELSESNSLEDKDLPVVFLEDGSLLKNPKLTTIAEKLGLNIKAQEELYDVIIIGAGPAGLAAAVYGGSEGLKTLLIDKKAPGGQAGTSSRIENYLGFPKGLSGSDLARRAITQATRFGIEFLSPVEVKAIEVKDSYKTLTLSNNAQVKSKTVVIATGVDYRKLPNKGMEEFTGAGVYYGAATTEAHTCKNGEVYVVGGGNSAGQGAMYLSKFAKKVYIVIRRDSLVSTMSSYLIDQINTTANIEILPNSEIIEAKGDSHLEALVLRNNISGQETDHEARAIFIFIGAKPYTEWTGNLFLKDKKGFLVTGREVLDHENGSLVWKQDKTPYLLETSVPGIFASGDVRSGAMNRVASAVGEGSMSISLVHKYLNEN
ncbi:FAD-dependent oxidoreductase [Muricauda sp. SCSIO 64092]|uniref:FAD-dependent oxidoreductase n=1 Tax=Allomuricauda sp. SCSIO 64092 TaxID=2908842 RepID=UPI001FF5C497|nr:FAD-dependent oxidoreductase [Muricauda sp. SCSIO 64092]UOY08386.1 FAD-dependent oxidoreductase [Muricauda sp. SCSIO 64092]